MERTTYITYARPLDVRKGNGVRVYLREFTPQEDPHRSRGRSFFIDTTLDACVASYELDTPTAERFVSQWNDDQKQVYFSLQPFNGQKSVILAHLPDKSKDARRALGQFPYEAGLPSNFFLINQYSGSKDVRTVYPSFSVPLSYQEYPGHVSHAHRSLSFDEALPIIKNDVHLYIDIETMGWDEPGAQQQIAMVVFGTNKEWLPKLIFSKYDLGTEQVQGYDIVRFATDQELGDLLTARIRESDPLSIGGYNLHFDLIRELRERTKDHTLPKSRRTPSFQPGVGRPGENDAPKVLSGSGKTKSVQIHGRFVIDLYNKLSAELPFLPNVKLGTIMHYFRPGFSEGSEFEKGQTYHQLADAFRAAEARDLSKLAAAAAYTAEDGEGTLQLLMDQLEEVYVDALTLERRTESICKGFAGASDERWSTEFFRRKHTLLHRYKKTYTPRIRPAEDQQVYFTDSVLCQRDGQYQEAAFFYPALFLHACAAIFSAWPELNAHQKYYNTKGTIRRYRGLRKQQEITVLPMTEYFEISERLSASSGTGFNPAQLMPGQIAPFRFKSGMQLPFEALDAAFKEAYGNGVVSLRNLNRQFSAAVHKLQDICRPEQIINTSSQFLLLQPAVAQALEQEGLGITLAKGPAVSKGSKAFLAAHDTIYQIGSKLTRGTNSAWENETIITVLRQSLQHLGSTGTISSKATESAIEHAVRSIPSVERSKLLRKRTRPATEEDKDARDRTIYYGFLNGEEVERNRFLQSSQKVDHAMYEQSFRQVYASYLEMLAATATAQRRLW